MHSADDATLVAQVPVVGARGAGKSALIQSAVSDAAVVALGQEGEADGLWLQRLLCDVGVRLSLDLVELPSDERYLPLLQSFTCAAACVVFVVNLAQPNSIIDLEVRLAAGGRPRAGLLLIAGSVPEGKEERRLLAQMQNAAAAWGLQMLRAESVEQLESLKVLRAICNLILRDVPEAADPLHLLGRAISPFVQDAQAF